MVAGKATEELPPGWKEFVRDRNGRKIKYYSVAEDGKKFYSKQAVIRYVNKIDGNATQLHTETGCNNITQPQSEIDCSGTPQPQTETACNSTPQPQSEIDCKIPQPTTETGCNSTPQPHSEMDCGGTPQPKSEVPKPHCEIDCGGTPQPQSEVPKPHNEMDCINTPHHQQNEHGEEGSKSVDSGSAKTSNQLAWLPPGWIIKVNSKKSGATYKVYIDPATGAKFYSKPQVLQYLQTVSLGETVKENKNAVIGKPFSKGEVSDHKGLEKSQNCATEKETSNANTHSTPIACASEKETGNANTQSTPIACASEKETSNGNTHSTPIACLNAIEVSSVDGLPDGWSKEIRTKDIAGKIVKVMYFKDPVSGFGFRSKKDALRYIETGDFSKCKIKPKKLEAAKIESSEAGGFSECKIEPKNIGATDIESTEAGDFSKCKVEPTKVEATNIESTEAHAPFDKNEIYLEKIDDVSGHYTLGKSKNSLSREEEINKLFEDTVEAVKSVESTSIDGFPPGWTKEFKSRKAGKRKDTFYVDPISGYMFWSKLDALRYIETGDIKKCAIKPKKKGADENESTPNDYHLPSPVGERYSQQSTSGQLPISDELNYGTQNFDASNLKVEAENSTGLMNNIAEVTPQKSLRKKERKPRKSPPISEIRPGVLDKQEFATETPASKSDTKRLPTSVPGRTSKRLAGALPETSPNLQSSERSLRSRSRKSHEGEATTMTIDAVATVPEVASGDTFREPDMDEQKHGVNGRASKRLAGCQPEMPSNLQLSERSIRAAIRMACEDETSILPMITMNAVPDLKLQPQTNLPVLDANALNEQKLPNGDMQPKDVIDTPQGLKNSNKRKAGSSSSRVTKPRRSTKKPAAATPIKSSQLEPSITTTSVPFVLPQPLKSEPLPGTAIGKSTEGGRPAFPMTMEPFKIERTPDVADIVSMVVESISKMDEIEMNDLPLPLISDHAVSEMKTGSKYTEAPVEIKTVPAKTGIQLNEKPELENSKPSNPQGSYLSVVDSWSDSDPCLDFAFKTLTGAISLEDTLSYQACSQPQDNTRSVHANGQFRQSGSQNLAGSQQNIPSQFQGAPGYHVSSQARSTPSIPGVNGSFGQPGTQNHANFQQHTPTRVTSSWQHVQVEQPRNPSIPPGFDGVPPYRGVRNNPDCMSKDHTGFPGTKN